MLFEILQGTTGNPKAAVLTHFANVNNAYFIGKRFEYHTKVCDYHFIHIFYL